MGSDSYEDSNQKLEEWAEYVHKRNRFVPVRIKDKRNGLHPAVQSNIESLKTLKSKEPFPSSNFYI